MLGAPKKKYLGSAGPVEERGRATKSGVSLTSISAASVAWAKRSGALSATGGKQEGSQGDLTRSPGPDLGHGPALDHHWSLGLTAHGPTEWSLSPQIAPPGGQARSYGPLPGH